MNSPIATWSGRVAATATAVSLLALSACGSSDDDGDGIDITIGTFSWTAAAVQTEILTQIVDEHPELGIDEIESTNVDPAVGWAGLGKGDIDVLTEVNLPNQQSFADENADETELVSETYGGAVQGWFVPAYLVEDGGDAEGLVSVDQLADPKYAEAVGGVLYDSDPGWVTTEQNAARIEGFDLDIEHKPSSEAASLSQLKSAYDDEEPILIYLYRPHWVFNEYDLVQLEEPNPYVEGAFEDGGPTDVAIPTLAANIAARKDLKDRAPEFYELLTKFTIPLEDIEALLAAQQADDSLTAEDLAEQWLSEHQDEVDAWLQ